MYMERTHDSLQLFQVNQLYNQQTNQPTQCENKNQRGWENDNLQQ